MQGASWLLGSYLCDRIAAAGIAVQKRALRPEGTIIDDIRKTDLLVLTFPLYADGVPACLKRVLMSVAAAKPGPKKLAVVVNCGFIESHQNDTAIEICRLFAREAGFEWLGGLGRGGAGALGGKNLSDAGRLFHKTRQSFDLAAAALADGKPIPDEAIRLMRGNLVPLCLYQAAANVGFIVEGARRGAAFRLLDNPFQHQEV